MLRSSISSKFLKLELSNSITTTTHYGQSQNQFSSLNMSHSSLNIRDFQYKRIQSSLTSKFSQKKLFVIKVALIGLIQEIMMLLASTNSHNNSTLIRIFFHNNIVQWPFYKVILASITAIISSRFLEPTKDVRNSLYLKHFLQGVIQVCMYFTSSKPRPLSQEILIVCIVVCFSVMVWLCYQSQQAMQSNAEMTSSFKYIIVKIVFVTLFYIDFAFLVGLVFAIQIKELFIFSFMIWLMILGWSLVFGLLFLYSIEQLQNGKCLLDKSDFAAAATIAYGNMATPLC